MVSEKRRRKSGVNIIKSYNKDGNYLTTFRTYGKDIKDEVNNFGQSVENKFKDKYQDK